MPPPQSRKFDLSEQITDRLRDLVAKYPKGLGIVKEFLQNADDAGASTLRIIYDRRHHVGSLGASGMNAALGPALLFMNDQPFSPDDLLHIQTISDSAKRADASRIGRFGQGFCTAYSVSDEPSLLTGDTLVWFDPHRRIHERNRNAYAWDLRPAAEEWPAWVATFAPAGAVTDGTPFSGTIFRLPVRTRKNAPHSEIRREPFTDGDWEKILAEARATGPALLVFLRSILRLEIYEVLPSGKERLRLAIRTKDEDAVRRTRAPLRAAMGRPLDLLRAWKASDIELPATEFTHSFDVLADDDQAEVETWEVVNRLCRGPENALLDESLRLCEAEEKVLPWAGAAARRDGGWSSIRGGFACFLPLPEAGEAPVWQHGWFALDSSARRNLARVAVEDQSRRHVAWNRLLMEHGVGPSWARLLVRLRGGAAATSHPYEHWPAVAEPANEVDAACAAGFYQTVKSLPVFRGRVGNSVDWYGGTQPLLSLPSQWQAQLETPLSFSKVPVLAPPLPPNARAGLELSPGGPRLLVPEKLRQQLKVLGQVECPVPSAPRTWLSRPEWVTQIAAFCASDGKERLRGLPLALLANGSLRNFDQNDPVYLMRAEDKRLLDPFPRRRLDARYQKIVFDGKPVPAIGARALDVGGLIQLAKELDGATPPPAAWLQSFFERLEHAPASEITAHAKAIKCLALVPGAEGAMRQPGKCSTPLLPSDDDTLTWALQRLGVEFIRADSDLVTAIERFSRRHGGFVWPATAEVVAKVLVAEADELDWSACDEPDALEAILDLLSTARWDKVESSTREGLRLLPILPTSAGGCVAATRANTYVLADFEPPDLVAGELFLVDVRAHARWRPLFERLGVPTLDGLRFATDVVLPSLAAANAPTQDALLRWLRDEIPKLEPFLEERARNELHREIRATPILPVAGGTLEPPSQLYAPDVKVESLLGAVARKPDPARFSDEPDRWRRFFEWLRLLRSPRAVDLHAAILELTDQAEWQGVEEVRPALLRMITHLDEHWKGLHDAEVAADTTLATALATMAWLPARRLTAEECPMATPPEDRLYRPDELAANSIRDLVASQRPIVDGSFHAVPLEELGVVLEPAPEETLAHFEILRTAPIPTAPKALKAVRAAFFSIVRHLGSHTEAAAAYQDCRSTDEVADTVLVGRSWRSPDRVFFHGLITALPGACSVQDDAELAAAVEGVVMRKGLELLGVRPSPTHGDWLAVLERLAAEYGTEPLTDDAVKVANGALLELRTAEDEWLRSQSVNVPTEDQRLVPAQDAFLPGDPRLRHPMVTPIPIVANIRDIVEVAQRAGALPLHEALDERIHAGTRESSDPGLREWTGKHEALLRSEPFLAALHRLAFQQALQERSADVNAPEVQERLGRSRHLRLKIADRVRVQSRLADDPKALVFDLEVPSFLDERSGTLWLATAADRRMRDEVVRAVSRHCGVGDTLSLARLLECEPNEMHILLDEDGVAEVPASRELDETDVAAHDSGAAMGVLSAPDEPEAPGRDTEEDEPPRDMDVEWVAPMSSAHGPLHCQRRFGGVFKHPLRSTLLEFEDARVVADRVQEPLAPRCIWDLGPHAHR
jgi:sacsin